MLKARYFCPFLLCVVLAWTSEDLGAQSEAPRTPDFNKRLDIGGYFGIHLFSNKTKFGHLGITGLSTAPEFGPRIGYWVSPRFGVELSVSLATTSTRDSRARVILLTPEVVAKVNLLPDRYLYPVVLAGGGVGMSFSDRQSIYDSAVAPFALVGAGIANDGLGWLGFRLDARASLWQGRGDTVVAPEFQVMFSAYKIISLAKKSRRKIPEESRPSPPRGDEDEDGIFSDNDKCPEQAEDLDGLADEDGCPELDVDFDHVLDEVDRCQGKKENLNGYEDEDGCPDTLPKEFSTVANKDLHIKLTARNTLRPADVKKLGELAKALQRHPSVRLLIIGYADTEDTDEANLALAEKKGSEVIWVLKRKGAPAFQILPVALTNAVLSTQISGTSVTGVTEGDADIRIWVREP